MRNRLSLRGASALVAAPVALILAGCVAEVAPPSVRVVAPAPVVYVPAPPRAVVSVYVEPPISEPAPIAVGWAPPPLLVESPPPPPFDGAVWVGGYWVWQGDWVWAHGHWVGPPRPSYVWVHPYYENRDGVVLFITGHWAAPGVAFVPPPPGIHLTVEVAAAGVIAGPRPMGPNGCFIPAPPGSRPGIIVPAPIGTAPAVVTGAPPVVAVGMRVTANVNNNTVVRNTTVVNNTTTVNNTTNNITNVRNVTNITNVTIVAPAAATANGQAVNSSVPAQAHLAAAQPAVFKAQAPEPASTKPVPAFVHGKPPAPLPAAQTVNAPPARFEQHAQEAHSQQGPRQPQAMSQQAAHLQQEPKSQPQAPNPQQQAKVQQDPKLQPQATQHNDRPPGQKLDGAQRQPVTAANPPAKPTNPKPAANNPQPHPAQVAARKPPQSKDHPNKPGEKDEKKDRDRPG